MNEVFSKITIYLTGVLFGWFFTRDYYKKFGKVEK